MPEALISLSDKSHSPSPLTQLTEEERMFFATVRQFAQETIAPQVRTMDDEQQFAPGLVAKLFELGLMGIEIPEALRRGRAASSLMRCWPIEATATVDLRRGARGRAEHAGRRTRCCDGPARSSVWTWLPRLAAERVSAYALSEAGSGSDAFALQTRAKSMAASTCSNGRKLWITNAKEAGLFLVFATLDPAAGYKGITAFLVEKDFPGFSVGKKEDKLGIRAGSTCELLFEDCAVPEGECARRGRQGIQDRD